MEKLLIVLNHGLDNPTKATRAFQMAKVAKEKNIDITMFLVDDAVLLAKKDINAVENIKAPTGDELKAYLQYLVEKRVPILVCTPCAKNRGIKEEDLLENAKFATAYDLISLTMESKTLCF